MSRTRNVPQVLVGLDACVARAAAEQGGALWRLAEPGRQLDANMVRLLPGARVGAHVEEDLDVLLIVVEGAGRLGREDGQHGQDGEALEPRSVAWLPRGARRAVSAGPDGLVYLTVHQRRPALSIKGLTALTGSTDSSTGGSVDGGEGPCRLDRVCTACGRLSPEASARYCGHCGEPLPARDS